MRLTYHRTQPVTSTLYTLVSVLIIMRGEIMWFFKKSKNNNQQLMSSSRSCFSHAHQLPQQYTAIWFEFESGRRIDLTSHVVMEDPTGLYQFLRVKGQKRIAKQLQISRELSLHNVQTIVFYEKDYGRWRL